MKEKKIIFHKSLSVAHMIIPQKVSEGEVVVDATMGNGHDTLLLSKRVGATGKVYAFDVQKQAMDNTRKLLEENHVASNVVLIHDGHQNVDKYVSEKVSLVLFNLGYLPGFDRELTTQTETTITAIEKSLGLLVDGGLVLLVIYPGHEEGMKEKETIREFASRLPQNEYHVFTIDIINQINNPPVILGIEKNSQ